MSYSMNSSFLKSTQRISGLNSGFDTEALVKASLSRMQLKANTYTRSITSLGWKRDFNREINNKLSNFRLNFTSSLKQDQNMVSEFTFKQNKVTISGTSSAVSITAGPDAFRGSGSIIVEKLATATHVKSNQGVTADGKGLSGSDTLEQVAKKLKDTSAVNWFDSQGNMVMVMGDKTLNFTKDTKFSDFLNTINKADLGFEVSYSQLTDTMTVSHKATGSDTWDDKLIDNNSMVKGANNWLGSTGMVRGNPIFGAFQIPETYLESTKTLTADGSGVKLTDTLQEMATKATNLGTGWFSSTTTGKVLTVTIGGETLSFNKTTTTFGDMISKINEVGKQKGFSIDYSQQTDKLTISSPVGKPTVAKSLFSSDFLDSFGISDADGIVKGTDAVAAITHNGVTRTVTRSTNQFTIDGIGYTLNRKSNANETIDFSVARDIDATVDAVKKYIDGYNEVIKTINDMVTQKPNKKFQPLSDEERASMSAEQIEKWEAEAKKGQMYNNSTLQRLLSDMRSAFYTPIGDTGRIMANIGLTTTSDYMDGGQIQIDETALRAAITNNPDEVYRMFAQNTTTSTIDASGKTQTRLDHANSGLARRLNETIYQYVLENEGSVIPSMETEIRSQAQQEYDHLTKMYQEEERLYAKYAAMETALSKLNSQTSSLSSLLSAYNK